MCISCGGVPESDASLAVLLAILDPDGEPGRREGQGGGGGRVAMANPSTQFRGSVACAPAMAHD